MCPMPCHGGHLGFPIHTKQFEKMNNYTSTVEVQ